MNVTFSKICVCVSVYNILIQSFCVYEQVHLQVGQVLVLLCSAFSWL